MENNKKSSIAYLVIILILVCIIASMYVYYNNNSKNEIKTNQKKETITKTKTRINNQKDNTTQKSDNLEESYSFNLINYNLIYDAIQKQKNENNQLETRINNIYIYNDDVIKKESIPEKYKNSKYLYGECIISEFYKEEPTLVGGGVSYVETNDGGWVVSNRYFVYNVETKEIEFSTMPDMSI